MSNLYILNGIISHTLGYGYLHFMCVILILCLILVTTTENSIISTINLVGLLMTIAGYLFMLGINFIGLSYLLVYVGAVSILFLLTFMLINVKIGEFIMNDYDNNMPLAMLVNLFFPLYLCIIIIVILCYLIDSASIDNIFMTFGNNNGSLQPLCLSGEPLGPYNVEQVNKFVGDMRLAVNFLKFTTTTPVTFWGVFDALTLSGNSAEMLHYIVTERNGLMDPTIGKLAMHHIAICRLPSGTHPFFESPICSQLMK